MARGPLDFIGSNFGWTFNFFFAHLLFWIYGIPTAAKYGYSDHEKNGDGGIPSGPSGSGVFPISLLLVVIASFAWVGKLISYTCGPPKVEG